MPQFVPQFALEDLAERLARQLVPDPGATEDHGGLFAGPAQDYVDSIAGPSYAPL